MKKKLLFLVTSVALLPASVALANPYADYNPRYNPTRGYGGGAGYNNGYDSGYGAGYGEPQRPAHNGNANKQAYQQMMNNLGGHPDRQRQNTTDPYYADQPHYPQYEQRDPDAQRYNDGGYDRAQYDDEYYDERSAHREMEHAHHPSGYDSMANEMRYDERQNRDQQYIESGERAALTGGRSGSVFRSTYRQSEQQRNQERNAERGYDDSYQPVRRSPTQDTNRSRWR